MTKKRLFGLSILMLSLIAVVCGLCVSVFDNKNGVALADTLPKTYEIGSTDNTADNLLSAGLNFSAIRSTDISINSGAVVQGTVTINIQAADSFTLPTLNVNLFKDGQPFEASNAFSSSTIENKIFNYEFENAGHYELQVQFMSKQSNGTTSSMKPSITEFYYFNFDVISNEEYDFNSMIADGNLNFQNATQVTKNEKSFYLFNYSNSNSMDPVFPYLEYDPEHFNLSYTRTISSDNESVTSTFEYMTEVNGVVSQSKTNFARLTFVSLNTNKSNSVYYLTRVDGKFVFNESSAFSGSQNDFWLFNDIGAYKISLNYQVIYKEYGNENMVTRILDDKTDGGSYDTSNNTTTLHVVGFQAKYAYNNTDEKEFKQLQNNENNAYSDFTFKTDPTDENKTANKIFLSLRGLNDKSIIASTNQAPVWFDYYGTDVSGTYNRFDVSSSGVISETDAEGKDYNKGDILSTPGYYEVVINYKVDESISPLADNEKFEQIFAFFITNSSPQVSLLSENQSDNSEITLQERENLVTIISSSKIASESFTKNDVRVMVKEPGAFDSTITTKFAYSPDYNVPNNATFTNFDYLKYSTGNTLSYTVGDSSYADYFTNSGEYVIRVYFGTGSYAEYSFKIDKQDVKNYVFSSWVQEDANGERYIFSNVGATSLASSSNGTAITNNNSQGFVVYAGDIVDNNFSKNGKKPSGANIDISFQTITLSNKDNSEVVNYIGDTKWVEANYEFSAITSVQNYYSQFNTLNKNTSGNEISLKAGQIFSSQKIYLFNITDEAGWEYNYVVFFDGTEPNVIQVQTNSPYDNNKGGQFNIVSENTTLKFGSAKAISYNSSLNTAVVALFENYGITTSNNATTENHLIKQINSANYLVVPISGVTKSFKGAASTSIVADENGEFKDSITNNVEGIYDYTINLNSGKSLNYSIEVNNDNSKGMIITGNYNIESDYSKIIDAKYTYQGKRLKSLEAEATNHYLVVFEWQNTLTGDLAIESIEARYYPLIYDNGWKYSDTYTSYDILAGATINAINSEKSYYAIANTTALNSGGEVVPATQEGKYEIIRTYVGQDASAGLDYKNRYYTFFVDRNEIIQNKNLIEFSGDNSSKLVGKDINITLGLENNQKTFDNFYRATIDKTIKASKLVGGVTKINSVAVSLKTNILPIDFNGVSHKYGNQSITGNIKQNGGNADAVLVGSKAFDKLNYSIEYYSPTNSGIYIYNNTVLPENYGNINAAGLYIVRINDSAIENNSQITGNIDSKDYFAFIIMGEGPDGNFQTSDSRIKTVDNRQEITQTTLTENGIDYFVFNIVSNNSNPINTQVKPDTNYLSYQISTFNTSTNRWGAYVNGETLLLNDAYGNANNVKYLMDPNPDEEGNNLYSIKMPAFDANGRALKYKLSYQQYVDETYKTIETPTLSDISDIYTISSSAISSSGQDIRFTSSDVIYFSFSDPVDEYSAKVNPNATKVYMMSKSTLGYPQSVGIELDKDKYIIEQRFLDINRKIYTLIINDPGYDAEFNNKNERVYKVEIFYEGDLNQYVTYNLDYMSTKYLYIDRTAPTHTLNSIIQTNQNINAITTMGNANDYIISETDNTGNYSNRLVEDMLLLIDKNFVFAAKGNEGSVENALETTSIYFREINDNSTAIEKLPSLLPGDPRYTQTSTYVNLRFSVGNPNYELMTYGNTLYSTLAHKENLSDRIFEIIEVDASGNSTIYRVKFIESFDLAVSVESNEYNKINTTKASSNEHNIISALIDNKYTVSNGETLSSVNGFALKDIVLNDLWSTIQIVINDSDTFTYFVNPNSINNDVVLAQNGVRVGNINSVIESINSLFSVGNKYIINISSRIPSDYFSFAVKIVNDTTILQNVIVNDAGKGQINNYEYNLYDVNISNGNNIINIESITVYKHNQNISDVQIIDGANYASFEKISNDYNGKTISNTSGGNYILTAGSYIIYYTDNYGRQYFTTLSIGVDSIKDITFNGKYYSVDGSIETGNFVLITVQSYSVTIERANSNGEFVALSENEKRQVLVETIGNNGISTYLIKNLMGSIHKYKITFTDAITQVTTTQTIIIDGLFVNAYLKDINGVSIQNVLADSVSKISGFTSKQLVISFDELISSNGYTRKLSDYIITLYRGENSFNDASKTSSIINNNYSINEGGYYTIQITNIKTGESISKYFYKKASSVSLYGVYKVDSKLNKTLATAGAEKIDISNKFNEINNAIAAIAVNPHGYDRKTWDEPNVKNYYSTTAFAVEIESDKNIYTNFGDESNTIKLVDNENFTIYVIIVIGYNPYNFIDVFCLTIVKPTTALINEISVSQDTKTQLISALLTDTVLITSMPASIEIDRYYGINYNITNNLYANLYYNDTLINSFIPINSANNKQIFNLFRPGVWEMELFDQAGNRQVFGQNNQTILTINVISEVIFKLNGGSSIYGQTFNEQVDLEVLPLGYDDDSILITATRNGAEIPVELIDNKCSFADSGLYNLKINGSINGKALNETSYRFKIISPNEAVFAYEFSGVSGYYVSKVVKNGTDITRSISSNNIYNLVLSDESFGLGYYDITVSGLNIDAITSSESYTYSVKVGVEIPVLVSSIPVGTSTTSPITISYNPYIIFSQIGESEIYLDNNLVARINNSNSSDSISSFTINTNGDHYVYIKSINGNIISAIKVIKAEPLNTIAIVLIVVGSLALAGVIFVIIKLRLRMKVR